MSIIIIYNPPMNCLYINQTELCGSPIFLDRIEQFQSVK